MSMHYKEKQLTIRKLYAIENSTFPGFKTEGESRTKQAFKDESDINNIVKKYEATGLITYTNDGNHIYSDVSDLGDYQSALEKVIKAQTLFDSLPALARDRFDNDPSKFLNFVENPQNVDEMVKLGLATIRETPQTKGVPDSSIASPEGNGKGTPVIPKP